MFQHVFFARLWRHTSEGKIISYNGYKENVRLKNETLSELTQLFYYASEGQADCVTLPSSNALRHTPAIALESTTHLGGAFYCWERCRSARQLGFTALLKGIPTVTVEGKTVHFQIHEMLSGTSFYCTTNSQKRFILLQFYCFLLRWILLDWGLTIVL